MVMASWLLVLAVLAVGARAAVPEDEITQLPGLSQPPSWKQYSGYLKASGTRKLHYWFVESQSSTPKTDPVVLWLNGGPGCSSLLGLLTENGPFRVATDGKTVQYNPHSWNAIANMLFLEAPAGVGFSYSDDRNYTTDDNEVAYNNYLALKDFFMKYPEYKTNDFYITGESYGGIYVPTLSAIVVDDQDINFKGFAVGNGVTDAIMLDNSIIYFAYYHGLTGDNTWNNLMTYCCKGQEGRCNFYSKSSNNTNCKKALFETFTALYSSGLNVYNLYGECVNTATGLTYDVITGTYTSSNFGWFLPHSPQVQEEIRVMKSLPSEKLRMAPPCLNETNVLVYLSQSEVRRALHIPDSVQRWDSCSGPVSQGYKTTYRTVKEQYLKVLDAKKRVLVYNGDVDMACNFLGDEWFVDSLELKSVQFRKPWYYTAADMTKQVGGFARGFENLVYVTVRGSGHMVPSDKPEPALVMFTNFIKNNPF
ncbi:lysosomal protective protein-like [Haliotis cracherodii]|uniref:lysosomal protective protein-like n=1 Tax=Haliotis cracherodii TaxID=6455 RepID=UPI0039EA8D8C